MMVGKWQDPDLAAKRGFDRFFGLSAGIGAPAAKQPDN
jgi:hypothetical protein